MMPSRLKPAPAISIKTSLILLLLLRLCTKIKTCLGTLTFIYLLGVKNCVFFMHDTKKEITFNFKLIKK